MQDVCACPSRMLATIEISGAADALSRVVEWLVATGRHGRCLEEFTNSTDFTEF
jgi:hypothetical protein